MALLGGTIPTDIYTVYKMKLLLGGTIPTDIYTLYKMKLLCEKYFNKLALSRETILPNNGGIIKRYSTTKLFYGWYF